ncbi:MAG TPA: hypothetical protein VFV88_05345 [Steroidobacteraceae bacterium]|jgi:hypothetical protein|nr:hypothetical protein [Steroidobacteraceae bacterium]
MKRLAQGSAALIAGLALSACGGGGYGSPSPPPAAPTPPPPPSGIALTSSNYQNALKVSVGSSISAFTNARIGAFYVADTLAIPLNIMGGPCPVSGTLSIAYTDTNQNGLQDKGDAATIQWEQCNSGGLTQHGILRVDILDVTPLVDGKRLSINVATVGLQITPNNIAGASTITYTFLLPMRYTRTSTSDRYEIAAASFHSAHLAGQDGLEMLIVDLQQDYATNTYRYSMSGSIDSDVLGGGFQFETTEAFTGFIGEFPSAGRLVVTGGNNTKARLAEEDSALTNPDTVLAAVDSNGDGMDDTVEPELQWSGVLPLLLFESFRGSIVVTQP